ncbi:MAG TPA: porin family protein [Mucilaginibacter sp.]|jgi:hypothetical protein
MKKIFTTLLILGGIYSAASGQTKNTLEFGANIGVNTSSVTYAGTNQNSDYTTGVNAAFSLEYYFSDRWGIQGKLINDRKGWGNGYLTFDDGSEIDGVDFHLNYLTIPIMADWHFGRQRNWYLHFGPYVGILLSSSESSHSAGDIGQAFNSTDFGLDAGIGVKFPVSRHVRLFIEADGQGGFTDIFKNNPDGAVQNVRSSINFGFLIPIK